MKLSLVTVPHPALIRATKPVPTVDRKIQGIVKEMTRVLESCKDPEGVGLAATQVGLSLRLFITKPYPQSKVRAYINPRILKAAETTTRRKNALEGCLSVTNTWSNIERPKWVLLEYQDLAGQIKTEKFMGWEAQIIQHEMDHLQGVLFTHRAMEQDKYLYRIEKNGKGKEELVPIEL